MESIAALGATHLGFIGPTGKVCRDGMGQANIRRDIAVADPLHFQFPGLLITQVLDLLITNALIIDWSGIYKVSIISSLCLPKFTRSPHQGGYWCSRRQDRWTRESGKPTWDEGRAPRSPCRLEDRSDRRRKVDRNGRGSRCTCALYMPSAVERGKSRLAFRLLN
jgi:hypothetical protein